MLDLCPSDSGDAPRLQNRQPSSSDAAMMGLFSIPRSFHISSILSILSGSFLKELKQVVEFRGDARFLTTQRPSYFSNQTAKCLPILQNVLLAGNA